MKKPVKIRNVSALKYIQLHADEIYEPGWTRPQLGALIVGLSMGEKVGAITRESIELLQPSGAVLRWYNDEIEQPWAVRSHQPELMESPFATRHSPLVKNQGLTPIPVTCDLQPATLESGQGVMF